VIQRYDMTNDCDGDSGRCNACMLPHPDGDYVAHADHLAAMAAKDAEIAKLKSDRLAVQENLQLLARAERAEQEAAALRALTDWSWIRTVMSQAVAIYQDYAVGKHASYEHYVAWLDAAAAEREQELHAAAAARAGVASE